jgi:Family of unknown function (DUF6527)
MLRSFSRAWEFFLHIWYSWIYRHRVRRVSVSELPEEIQPNRLYLIGNGEPWAAAMLCPCGCTEVIHLSLLRDDSPTWSLHLTARGSLPTVSPSHLADKGLPCSIFPPRRFGGLVSKFVCGCVTGVMNT